jgi:fermentation-respiration switch protein FrsA (DUF1100 family)
MRPSPGSRIHRLLSGLFTVTLMALLVSALTSPARADVEEDSFERGPDPDDSLVEAARGPFSTDTENVSSFSASGFGGGTIHYPTDTSEGTFGGIAISPGYTASSSTMAWYGPRLASHGFVVFVIDTNSRYDQPNSRGRQLQAALDHLVDESDLDDVLDPDRLAVMGHSMGGGGSLYAVRENPDLKAAVPLTPWHTTKSWSSIEVPTMIIGAENDITASVRTHSIPFYESLDDDLNRAYLELDGASHFAPNLPNDIIGKYSLSWLKRFVDNDERYDQFLCPPPDSGGLGNPISDYRDSCPHG